MKKLLVSLMVLIIALTSFSITTPCKADVTQADIAIAKGRSMIGSTAYVGYCQRFVRHCYEAAGISGWADSATLAGNYWIVSTSRDNIPIGATVYFTSNSVYGHVGIYTGNGYMLNAMDTVREELISDYWWARFRGWGYQGGVVPTGARMEPDITPPGVSGVNMNYQDGNAFSLAGYVSDNRGVAGAVFTVTNGAGVSKNYQAYIENGIAYGVCSYADFNWYEGVYSVALTVVDTSGNQNAATGNALLLDLYSPQITDIFISDFANNKYRVEFKYTDLSECTVSCKTDEEVDLKFDGEKYYYEVEFKGLTIPSSYITVIDSWGHESRRVIDIVGKIAEPKIEITGFMNCTLGEMSASTKVITKPDILLPINTVSKKQLLTCPIILESSYTLF